MHNPEANDQSAVQESLLELAGLQASNYRSIDPTSSRQQVRGASELESLLSMLCADSGQVSDQRLVAGVDILGRRKTRFFHDALAQRYALLQPLINLSQSLPGTYPHPVQGKIAGGSDANDVKPLETDAAFVGPAGLYVHKLFHSCSQIVGVLLQLPDARTHGIDVSGASLSDGGASRETQRAITAYEEKLAALGYANADEIREALAGAVCLGLVHEITGIAQSFATKSKGRRNRATSLEEALDDLLETCDLLALQNSDYVLHSASDYLDQGQSKRAHSLLQRHLQRDAQDVEALALLGQVLESESDIEGAINAYTLAVELAPADWTLRRDLGIALLGKLRYEEGIRSLRHAMKQEPSNSELAAQLERAETLQRWLQESDKDDVLPCIAANRDEQKEGRFREETLALAEHLYCKYGTLLIDNVFDPAMLNECRQQFLTDYQAYLGEHKQADALQIGHRRFQVSLTLRGAFNQPDFYANPFVLGVMKRLIGRKVIIGSTVCATSLPGARDQHLHKDNRALFAADDNETPTEIPPVAITTMIPLVALDEKIGTTLVKKGSHRLGVASSEQLASQMPMVPLGSCFLMDLALSHQGLGNQTEQVRPIVNMVYHQHWFADNRNFRKQPPLQIESAEYDKIPTRHRRLFDWAIQPGPKVDY